MNKRESPEWVGERCWQGVGAGNSWGKTVLWAEAPDPRVGPAIIQNGFLTPGLHHVCPCDGGEAGVTRPWGKVAARPARVRRLESDTQ